jgi:hypothetical protein
LRKSQFPWNNARQEDAAGSLPRSKRFGNAGFYEIMFNVEMTEISLDAFPPFASSVAFVSPLILRTRKYVVMGHTSLRHRDYAPRRVA